MMSKQAYITYTSSPNTGVHDIYVKSKNVNIFNATLPRLHNFAYMLRKDMISFPEMT